MIREVQQCLGGNSLRSTFLLYLRGLVLVGSGALLISILFKSEIAFAATPLLVLLLVGSQWLSRNQYIRKLIWIIEDCIDRIAYYFASPLLSVGIINGRSIPNQRLIQQLRRAAWRRTWLFLFLGALFFLSDFIAGLLFVIIAMSNLWSLKRDIRALERLGDWPDGRREEALKAEDKTANPIVRADG